MTHLRNCVASVGKPRLVALALGLSFAAQSSAPEIAFDSIADFLKMPNDIYVGEVAGVGANSKGQT